MTVYTPRSPVPGDRLDSVRTTNYQQCLPGRQRPPGTCNGSSGQQWSPYSDATTRAQGGCLDVVSAGTTSGTNVDWYPRNGTAAQGWTHQSNGEHRGQLADPRERLGKTTTASSTENAGFPAADATDGNTGTRWSSAFSDPQWLEVDLGSGPRSAKT
jgi:hypothetical protein